MIYILKQCTKFLYSRKFSKYVYIGNKFRIGDFTYTILDIKDNDMLELRNENYGNITSWGADLLKREVSAIDEII